ncbi:hypothetical protein [Pleionea sp. CnH1-48]|uniref:hypothetical protein n=1 Tax=Pleionea sp. CnH1-48 TaxID=2954494 RepID=UPI0020986766|nr:hypothetical protein [Pleionea sp. CnH1-48]MCO7226707.1 hypothetical protein [Pleionea sp. CnH1-48]
MDSSIGQSLKKNLVSIISLIVAIVALTYNTWRNEQTEDNRNIRAASFEILRECAHLQLLTDLAFYGSSKSADSIDGWVRVNFILSLTQVMPSSVRHQAAELKQMWTQHSTELHVEKNANEVLTQSINDMEQAVLDALEHLE